MESHSSEDEFFSASDGSDDDEKKESTTRSTSEGSPTSGREDDDESGVKDGKGEEEGASPSLEDETQFVVKNLDTGETSVVKIEELETVMIGEEECIVRNLDTGESFSSKEIEKLVPKGIDPRSLDPIAYNILKRSPASEEDGKHGNRWVSKINSIKKKSLGSSSSKSKKKNLFAQISRQCLKAHDGAVWIMRFSYDGTYMASAGNDAVLRIWEVAEDLENGVYFTPTPFRLCLGHTGDILDITWSNSRSNLILTASMDHTVKQWDVNKSAECKYSFRHRDVVTAVVIHPKNEELFITGCLDNRLRVWNMVEKTIIYSTMVDCGFITAVAFTFDGDTVVTGSYNGKISFFRTKNLQHVLQRPVAGPVKKGKKITGIQMMPNSHYVLISSNDSRMRLFDLKDFSRVCGYKGLRNENFQLYAGFSEKGQHIVCGSEDHHVYIWPNDLKKGLLGTKTTKVHDSFQAHSHTVTAALFAPVYRRKTKAPLDEASIIVSADITGEIRVFQNKLLTGGRGQEQQQ